MTRTNHPLKTQFLTHLESERRVSENTVSNYARDISKFLDHLRQIKTDLTAVDLSVCRGYVQYLESTGYARRSTSRAVATLRSFWRYMQVNHVVSDNPWKRVQTPKLPRKLPKIVSGSQMDWFLASFNQTPVGIRDRAICELLYGAGLRVSELVQLDMADLQLEAREIRVLGKGNKERIAIFGDQAYQMITTYLSGPREKWAAKTPAIFVNQRGGRLTVRSIQRMIKGHAKRLGYPDGVTPHTLRHSFATDLLNGGADLRVVQELLGHANLTTTQVYTHLSVDQLKKTIQQSHPLASED